MIKTFEDMIELMHTYWGGDEEFHKDLDKLLELHNAELKKWEEEHTDALYRAEMKGRADALEEVDKEMYHQAFNVDHELDGLQKWDSGNWIRYKLFENVIGKLKEKNSN